MCITMHQRPMSHGLFRRRLHVDLTVVDSEIQRTLISRDARIIGIGL
jgi:hypothetical protein